MVIIELRAALRKEETDAVLRAKSRWLEQSLLRPKPRDDVYGLLDRIKAPTSKDFCLQKANGAFAVSQPDIRELMNDQWNVIQMPNPGVSTVPSSTPLASAVAGETSYLLAPITSGEVGEAIKRLDLRKSHSTSGISHEMFQYLHPSAYLALATLFNTWFAGYAIPAHVQACRLELIHKKGLTMDIGNYRTIGIQDNLLKLYCSVLNK